MNIQRTLMNHYNTALNSPQEIANLRGGIIALVKQYIEPIIKEFPNITADELREKVIGENREYAIRYVSIADSRTRVYQIDAMEYLLKNPAFFDSEYSKLSGRKFDGETIEEYNSNFLQSAHSAMVQCYSLVQTIRREIEEDPKLKAAIEQAVNSPENEKKRKREMKPEAFKEFKLYMNLLKSDEKTQVRICMKFFKERLEDELKDNLIDCLELTGEYFKKYGNLRADKNSYDRYLESIGLKKYEEITYRIDEKGSTERIGINQLFTREYLSKLDLEEITILNIFWQNKLSKTVQNVNRSLFAIDKLNLWEDIRAGKKLDISEEQLEGIYANIKTLSVLARILFNENIANAKTENIENNGKYDRIDLSDSAEKLLRRHSAEYKRCFDSVLPGYNNDLDKDLETFIPMANAVDNVYYIKDSNILSMVTTILKSKKIRNWGYIAEPKIVNGKKVNSIQAKSKRILIGIDYEGFNIPLRFHVDREAFTNFFINNQNNTIIPIYQGNDDFRLDRRNVETPIFMPTTKRMKNILREECIRLPQGSDLRKLYSHLIFLGDVSKFPEHLKEKDENGKRQRRQHYIDLKDGKEYIKRYKEFEEVPEGSSTNNGDGLDGRC